MGNGEGRHKGRNGLTNDRRRHVLAPTRYRNRMDTRRGVPHCRQCHDLAHSSTRMDTLERATERVRAVRGRFGVTGRCDPFAVPPRPPGMRAATYARLRAELEAAQRQRDAACVQELASLTKRLNRFTRRR
jgi:hypothetical protein